MSYFLSWLKLLEQWSSWYKIKGTADVKINQETVLGYVVTGNNNDLLLTEHFPKVDFFEEL